jgi:hypothetical protein
MDSTWWFGIGRRVVLRGDGGEKVGRAAEPRRRWPEAKAVLFQQRADLRQGVADRPAADVEQVGEALLSRRYGYRLGCPDCWGDRPCEAAGVSAAVRIAVSREVEADTEPSGQKWTFSRTRITSDQADRLSFSITLNRHGPQSDQGTPWHQAASVSPGCEPHSRPNHLLNRPIVALPRTRLAVRARRDLAEALARLRDLVAMELFHRSARSWPLYATVIPLEVPAPAEQGSRAAVKAQRMPMSSAGWTSAVTRDHGRIPAGADTRGRTPPYQCSRGA